jgi:hypothetical protein
MTNEQQGFVRINDREYALTDLSDDAKAQLKSLRITDVEIERLRAQLAIYKTARIAYARELEALLPKIAQ